MCLVQPFVFVTVTLKENKKIMLSTGHVSARHSWQPLACILPGETQNLCFANYTKCSSHTHDSNMDSCFLPMQPFFLFLLYSVELILPSTLLVALRSSLPGNTNWFQATLTGFDRCHGSVMLGRCWQWIKKSTASLISKKLLQGYLILIKTIKTS